MLVAIKELPSAIDDTMAGNPFATTAGLGFVGCIFIMRSRELPAIRSIPMKTDCLSSRLATYCT